MRDVTLVTRKNLIHHKVLSQHSRKGGTRVWAAGYLAAKGAGWLSSPLLTIRGQPSHG